MILRKKNYYCKDTVNELNSYHNKIVWANFVLMQDSWQRSWCRNSTSGQKTLNNSHNLQIQWLVVSTLCQDMKNHLTERLDSRGTPKLGPCKKSQPATCKVNMEWKLESVNKDNSHSWVRISHGLNKLVTDLIDKEYDDNEQETSETKPEVFALKTEVFAFASRSKAKAKPRRPSTTCSSTRNCAYSWKNMDWYWTRRSIRSSVPSGRKTKTLFFVMREEDGAIVFWRPKDDLRNKFEHSQHWSDDMWKSKMAGGGGNKKRFQYCIDSSGQEVLYLRALQGHSGRNSIDASLQDTELIPNDFFEYICHIGCAINLHSITNSGLIAGGQNSSRERQTVFFTAVNPMNKDHRDPQELDLTKPRLASYKQKWKKAPGYGVLGRYTACSTERIELLSKKI